MDDNVNSNSEFKGVNRSVQTGITEYYNMAHLWRWAVFRELGGARLEGLTVDGDGDGLCQNEAIGADKGGNSSKRVQLEIFSIDIGRTGFDELDVEVILLCDG